MACELMEAKEELRKLRDARDENVRMLNDAKFSLMRSEHMQSSTISDCPARNPTNSTTAIIATTVQLRSVRSCHPSRTRTAGRS